MLIANGTFTSEAVSPGHPDKIADQISDAILDACLTQDPGARVAIECAIKGDLICLMGEITAGAAIDAPEIARQVLREIGHEDGAWGLNPDTMEVITRITRQSPEIGARVDGVDTGAGDQGIMFGFACDDDHSLMPAPIVAANALRDRMRTWQTDEYPDYCGPDGKTQATVRYENGRAVALETVVMSCQHAAHVGLEEIRDLLLGNLMAELDFCGGLLPRLITPETRFLINTAGTFHEGGPVADAGLTGRKIIADSYGGFARHGGGAFSGKDATKLDRSGAYAARQLARDVVARGWAKACEVRVAYAIGEAAPVAIGFDTFGTGGDPAPRYRALGLDLAAALRPRAIIERLGLTRPIYRDTARYGHFGRMGLPWEQPLLG
jgi:S-adenosylmethionine synthetase